MSSPETGWLSMPWPVTDKVRALTTLRGCLAGVSQAPFERFNLAMHVADHQAHVQQNRHYLVKAAGLPAEPVWMHQVHGNKVINLDDWFACDASRPDVVPQGDAACTRQTGRVCAVLTADCLPVFFCNQQETEVAVAHAGWRGLLAGVLENTLASMQSPASQIQVCFGPAIGPLDFEVGVEVYQAFVEKNPEHQAAFQKLDQAHYLCDIYQLAETALRKVGVKTFSGGDWSTFQSADFYSYRQNTQTGRMASLIWLET